jgi:hypothetical protein
MWYIFAMIWAQELQLVIQLESHKNKAAKHSSHVIHKNSTQGDVDGEVKNDAFSNVQILYKDYYFSIMQTCEDTYD